MKKILLISLTIFICITSFISCDDWTEVEAKDFNKNGKSPEYYADLRKWKAETDHDMAFGWFAFWSASGVDLKSSMIGLPDSMHLVSVWGPWHPNTLTDAKREDMKYIQEVKGTKVMACSFMGYVGEGLTGKTAEDRAKWGWTWEHIGGTGDNTSCKNCIATDAAERQLQINAIKKYAKAMVDSVLLGGYNGLDVDYEPTWSSGEISNHKENMEVLIKALAEYLGPKSPNPSTLLVVDGEVEKLTKETAPYLNYLIKQNYWSNEGASDAHLDNRLKSVLDNLVSDKLSAEQITKMYFSTVNFESYAPTGGGTFTRTDGTKTSYLQGHAEWQPQYNGTEIKKGGFGAYHIEMEYSLPSMTGFYPWTRAAINTVHPVGK